MFKHTEAIFIPESISAATVTVLFTGRLCVSENVNTFLLFVLYTVYNTKMYACSVVGVIKLLDEGK